MVLRNSSMVVAPMHCICPRASAGLSILAASMLPCDPPAPMMVCISSIYIIISGFFSSSMSRLRTRSSNWPLNLVPATSAAMSSVSTRLPQSWRATLRSMMRCASPSTMALLPTPGSPMSMGLFFFLRDRICATRSISLSRPTTGSSSPLRAFSVRSVQKLSSTGVPVFDVFFLVSVGESLSAGPLISKPSSSPSLSSLLSVGLYPF